VIVLKVHLMIYKKIVKNALYNVLIVKLTHQIVLNVTEIENFKQMKIYVHGNIKN
jgi:hypothetical protein